MSFSTCDTGKTSLDFAITKHSCRLSPAMIGPGNVESTPIGFVRNGQSVAGYLPVNIGRNKCKNVQFKAVPAPC